MPSLPAGSQYLTYTTSFTSIWYLTTDTGGVYDTKIYNAGGTLLVDIPNSGPIVSFQFYYTSVLFGVELANGAGRTAVYATDGTPAGTGIVTTVPGGTPSAFTTLGPLVLFQVTMSTPASAMIGGTLHDYTAYTSTLYSVGHTPGNAQPLAEVSYGTPLDESDGGFTDVDGSLFTATTSSLASHVVDGVPDYETVLDTTLYTTNGTSAGTEVVLPNISSVTALALVGNGRTVFDDVSAEGTKVYSVDASGGDLQLLLTLDGVYSVYPEIDFRGNQFLGETDGTTFGFYVTDGTAAGTQLLLTTPATTDEFVGSSLGIDFFQFNSPTSQQLYETGLTAATTHLVATIPLDEVFDISPIYDIMLPPPEDINIVVSELDESGTVVKQFWINPYNEAIVPAGDEYEWIGPISGDWNTASNWEDTTLGTDPASAPPDSNDDVDFDNPGDQFQIIGGTGASYQLSFYGEHTVVGTFTTGVLWVSGYVGELQIDQGGSVSAGFGLLDVGVTIDVGVLSFSNSLTIEDPHILDTAIDTVVTVTDGRLDVGGTLTVSGNSMLFADGGGKIQAGALATDSGSELRVDGTSSIEVGDAGGATLGALTVDAGATFSVTESAAPVLGSGDIIDNGIIAFIDGTPYRVPVVLLGDTSNLSGNGQVLEGDYIDAVIGGSVRDGSLAFQIGNDSSLTLEAVGAGNTIALNGDGVVALDGQETYDPSTHGEVVTFDMEAAISGFDASDTITIDRAVTNATYTAGTGTLSLTDGTILVATVTLDGNYTGDTFLVTPGSPSVWDVTVVSGALTVIAPASAALVYGRPDPVAGLRLAEAGNTPGERFTVTLSDANGPLTATGTGVTLTGAGTTSLTISGPLAQVNAALATVEDSQTYSLPDTLTLAASDSDGNTASRTVAVAAAVTPQPVVQAPVSATTVVGRTVAIGGVSIAEAGSTAGEIFTVTVQDQRALLAATGPGVSGSGTTGGLTITGTLAQVNAALATLTDSVSNSAPDKIQVFVTDSLGNHAPAGGIAIGVNGKPVIAAPAAATVGVGLPTTIAGVSLSESGTTTGERFTVTLSDTAGLLAANDGGVTLTGAGTTSLTISGALPQVNAALATLADTASGTASDTITLTASDSYGGLATAASIPVTVSGVVAPAAAAYIRATALHLGGVADPAWGTGEGGVTVSLLNGMGAVIATAVTTKAGQAAFAGLAAGTYELHYVAPPGQGFVPGSPDSAAGVTVPVTVAAGQSVIGPSGDLIATLLLNGTGLSATPAAGGYLVTGNAADSTLTLGSYNEFVTLTGGGDRVTTGNGSETIALSGVGNIVSVGVGNSVINAGSGGAMVQAAGGDVTITAAGAGNRLDGGSGLSFLNADGSADNVFVLGAAGTPRANMTTVTGFNPAAGDILDLKHTLAAADIYLAAGDIFSLTPQFGIFITAVAAGPNTVLLADPTGGYGTPTAFATLLNTHVSVAQLQALNAFSIS